MGVKIPFLPISEMKEKILFTTLSLQHSLNIPNITKSWIEYVNGINISLNLKFTLDCT